MTQPPTLYFDGQKWTETSVPGAPSWQHKSWVGYQSWKRSQAHRERRQAANDRGRVSAMECLWALLAHWEAEKGM
jgi:hypothetical protein